MKKQFYIFSFTVLGFLTGLVVYGLGSLIMLNQHQDFEAQTYLWIMLLAGLLVGFFEGKRWWRIIYVEKAYLKWPKHKLETKLLGLLILIIFTIAVLFYLRNYN